MKLSSFGEAFPRAAFGWFNPVTASEARAWRRGASVLFSARYGKQITEVFAPRIKRF